MTDHSFLDERHELLWHNLRDKKIDYDGLLEFRAGCYSDECTQCGAIVCPHGEPLHFHHDGCPVCEDEDATSHLSDEEFMELISQQLIRDESSSLPALYNWFLADINNKPLKPDEIFPEFYILGQVYSDKRGRPNGRWIRTSKVESLSDYHAHTVNSIYRLFYRASDETIGKLLSGEYGGDRGEPLAT